MRICPKCGFIDPPEWKHCKFSYHIDTIRLEEFINTYPNLAKNLHNGGDITEDENYYYRLTKTKLTVFRKAKIEWTEGNPFGAEKYERFNHGSPWAKKDRRKEKDWDVWKRVAPDQTKLLEITK